MDYSPPGSYVHEILQARILEWVALPFSRVLPDLGIKPGLNGHEFEQAQGDGEGQGTLVCCSPWGRKE